MPISIDITAGITAGIMQHRHDQTTPAQLLYKNAVPMHMASREHALARVEAPQHTNMVTCSQQGTPSLILYPLRTLHGSTCSLITRGIHTKMPFVTLGICLALAEGCSEAHVVPTL